MTTEPSQGGAPPAASRPYPPGRIKIAEALRRLLEEKEFGAITTAEIARQAGVTEALIYKYFKDKRDLLHQILAEYLQQYHEQVRLDLKGIKGALNQLRKLLWSHIHVYATNRVFARILLLEVRNYPEYFKSETYGLVKIYSDILLDIIATGVAAGEIRADVPPKIIRQVLLGSIEQICMTGIVFGREIDPDALTDDLCACLFGGIQAS